MRLKYSLSRSSFVIDLGHEQKQQNKMLFFAYLSRYVYCGDSLSADMFKYTLNIYENIKTGQKYPICYMFVRSFLSHVSSELHVRMNLYLTHLFIPNSCRFNCHIKCKYQLS